jgi:hypothetical protein
MMLSAFWDRYKRDGLMLRINMISAKSWAVLVFPLLLSLSGCGLLDSEKGIEKDRAEQQEILDGLFVTYWKGAKLSIRSIPIDEHTEAIDFAEIRRQQQEGLGLGRHLIRIYDWESFLRDADDEEKKGLTAQEFIELAQELYSLADTIEHLDEDSYPTFIEIVHHSDRILGNEPFEVPDYWTNSMEHWLFAIVMESELAPGSWKTYELSRVHPKDLATSDYRFAAHLHKGLDHLRNKWYYLADRSFTAAITESNDPNVSLNEHVEKLLADAEINGLSPRQQFKLIARASSHLLRGFSRHQSENDDLQSKAIEDIQIAVADFQALGADNELVWIAESYVYIQNEDKENAIASLTKLETSPLMTEKERTLIAEAKRNIQDRDPDSALNFLTDRIIMYKLGWSYAQSYAIEIEWMRLLEKTEQGRRILERFSELKQTFEKAKGYLDLDNLKNKGESLLKEITE